MSATIRYHGVATFFILYHCSVLENNKPRHFVIESDMIG